MVDKVFAAAELQLRHQRKVGLYSASVLAASFPHTATHNRRRVKVAIYKHVMT